MLNAFSSRRLVALASAGSLALAAALIVLVGSAGATSGAATSPAAAGGSISRAPWGTTAGKTVYLYTLRSGRGMVVKIATYGGVVQSIYVPNRQGRLVNVALGFSRLSDYVNDFQHQPWPASGGSGDTYFGAIIGRYANRIANHSFTLNGKKYNLPGNNGPNNINTLHGGPNAYNTKVWQASTKVLRNGVALQLRYTDPAGYNGFPGAVANVVTYTVTRDNTLHISYRATTTAPTVVNFTNHTYFNLSGEGSGTVYGQLLQINARKFQPTNAVQIPTGFASVAGTPFDFRRLKPIGRDIRNASAPYGNQLVLAHGYDHNWVLNGSGYRLAAVALDPSNGVTLRTYTDQPGVQLYTSNFLVGDLVGTSGRAYRQGDGFTLETQHFPDTPHHIGAPGWPSVVLNPGKVFTSQTAYQFGVL